MGTEASKLQDTKGGKMKIMVSACLTGEKCKYNGGSNFNEKLMRYLAMHEVVTVCPEVLGGLPTPRFPCEIVDGTVLNRGGKSCDEEYRRGAEIALETARREQADVMILQSRSPSCGVKQVYDGSFSGTLRDGQGVFAEAAMKSGFRVLDVADWAQVFDCRKLKEEEIPTALELVRRVFTEYESPDYAPEGTAEFDKSLHDEAYLAGIEYYGAFDGERLIGAVGLRPESMHICFFFVDGDYHRLGVGTRMMETVKAAFPNRAITLNASPYGLPFYLSQGFTAIEAEKTVNGIRFTPMVHVPEGQNFEIVKLTERPELLEKAVEWFSSKWGVPAEAYRESMEDSMNAAVPSWYLCLNGDSIIGGMGVIENDFHDRPDLAPNVCAVYTEPFFRGRGIAGRLLDFVVRDMHAQGIDTLYLLTDHDSFYERYGWEYFCPATGDGEEKPSRMYRHQYGE